MPQDYAYPWTPDQGDGTYRNPIIYADYSDPDVVRNGEDYYLTASSFTNTPGLPILHSRDLVNWTIVNYAIKNVPMEKYDAMLPGCGVWAPSIRKHGGKFWIFFPTPDDGIYVTTATDPKGEWSKPWMLLAGKGLIDPCPLWDEDGKAYMVHAYARSRAGIKHRLRIVPISPDCTKDLGEGQVVFDMPDKHPTLEGPKFHKLNGFYYISAPAGGVATGWQTILRSKNIYGPYEDKIVLAQGKTPVNGPHQGALVDTPAGDWWFVHFQDVDLYGRITHLQPVVWKDNWPVIGDDADGDGTGDPVLRHRKPINDPSIKPTIPATTDEFDAAILGLQWQWQANHQDGWYDLHSRPGHLRLKALPPANSLTTLTHSLGQKLPARSFKLETMVELGPGNVQAGLVVNGKSHAALILIRDNDHTMMRYVVDDEVIQEWVAPTCSAVMSIQFADGGPCTFSFRFPDGKVAEIAKPYQTVIGQWIGAKVGLLAIGNTGDSYADFDYFRFSAI